MYGWCMYPDQSNDENNLYCNIQGFSLLWRSQIYDARKTGLQREGIDEMDDGDNTANGRAGKVSTANVRWKGMMRAYVTTRLCRIAHL